MVPTVQYMGATPSRPRSRSVMGGQASYTTQMVVGTARSSSEPVSIHQRPT